MRAYKGTAGVDMLCDGLPAILDSYHSTLALLVDAGLSVQSC
jgi:hypothetical protein